MSFRYPRNRDRGESDDEGESKKRKIIRACEFSLPSFFAASPSVCRACLGGYGIDGYRSFGGRAGGLLYPIRSA